MTPEDDWATRYLVTSTKPLLKPPKIHPANELAELRADLPAAIEAATMAIAAVRTLHDRPDLLKKFLYAQSKVRAMEQRIRELEAPP